MRDDVGGEYSLRPANPEDLRGVIEIEHLSHVAPWTEENFLAECQKPYSQVWIITDDETDSVIAGYVVFTLLFETAEILNLTVAPLFRGRGFGKESIRRVAAYATRKGARNLVLEVRRGNEAAVRLYQGQGFDICQIRRQFYTNGEDAYHMKLPLQDAIFKLD